MDSADHYQVTFLSMNLPIIVINKLFNESFIFFLHLISHVRDIAQNSFILHLKRDQNQFRAAVLANSQPGVQFALKNEDLCLQGLQKLRNTDIAKNNKQPKNVREIVLKAEHD